MKVTTSYSNFARGQVDHDMQGRFDSPIYTSGLDVCENFITNFKGNALFRTGFEDMLAHEDCALFEFKFNNAQNYIVVMTNLKMRFLSYDINGVFGWVLDGVGATLEVVTPYSLAESKEIAFRRAYSQNADVMVIVHEDYAPRKLTRVSATSFTLATFVRTSDPFTSATTYPSSVLFYKGRLFYAATISKPTTVWGSESANYDVFTIPATYLTTSAMQFTIADIAQKIEWLYAGENSLIAGAGDGIVAINGGGVNTAITAETVEANVTSAESCNSVQPIGKDGLVFYSGMTGRNMYYFRYDILTESFVAQDANLLAYDMTEGEIVKARYFKDRNNLLYVLLANGTLLTCNFFEKENINGWHVHSTEGLIKDIVSITDNNGIPHLYALVLRNSVYYIERLSKHVEFHKRTDFYTGDETADNDAYIRYVAEQMNGCTFLDNFSTLSYLKTVSITYNSGAGTITAASASFVAGDVGKHITYKTATGYESGRFLITGYTSTTVVSVTALQTPTANTYASWYLSFLTISGLSRFNGLEVSVVADGGYVADYTVSGGAITLPTQSNYAIVGYKYRGTLKSFCLGFSVQGHNTQTTMKAISRVGVRTNVSAGGKIGSTPYRLDDVQELTPNDLNYLPAIPMDGTKYVTYTDDNEIDKYLYVVQDAPLPLHITNVMVEASYS